MRSIGSKEVCGAREDLSIGAVQAVEALPGEDGSCVKEGSRPRTAAEGHKGKE